jgi:HPt (histidine-containing phosphotransfer) domain-containing protein
MGADKEEEDFMNELKREFKATVGKNMVELPSFLKEEKFEDIARIAHDIKGTAGLFALEKGVEIAKELQRAAQNKENERTKILIEELISHMKAAGIIEA